MTADVIPITSSEVTREWQTMDLVLQGPVVRGFGRGKADLQCPTANIDPAHVDKAIQKCLGDRAGVYAGTATFVQCCHACEVHKEYPMVLSIGNNPTYDNDAITIEAHLLHEFPDDFYGSELRLHIQYLIRTNTRFTGFGELKAAIFDDIRIYRDMLKARGP